MASKAAEKEAKAADAQLKAIMTQAANQVCADCGAPKPRFASITLAVFLCNRCYGIHRSVGAHITRTKCIGLDRWSLQDVHRMMCIGNSVASAYWEQNVPKGIQRPTAQSPDSEVEKWIRDKYEKRLFCPSDSRPPEAPPLEVNNRESSSSASAKPIPKIGAPAIRIAAPPSPDPDWKPFG